MTRLRARLAVLGPVLIALALVPQAAAEEKANPSRWEPDIRAFEQADVAHPPPSDGVVFIGSSSIRLWTTLSADFPGVPIVNRGFGGSQLPEVTAFVRRIVTPYRPRQVIVYCGGNDINEGRSAADVLADSKALAAAIHAALPATRIAFITIGPNPARWPQIETVRAANRLVAAWAATDPRISVIDVFNAMLGPDGLPKPDIFVEDRLHMNAKGYGLWRAIVGPHLR